MVWHYEHNKHTKKTLIKPYKPINKHMNIYSTLMDLNTRNGVAPEINLEIKQLINKLIDTGCVYYTQIADIKNKLINQLIEYRKNNKIDTVVIGMSGGIDSAVTAALFKQAEYRVIGVTLPIHQNSAETDRGIEACDQLGIEHVNIDLSSIYDNLVQFYQDTDVDFNTELVGDRMREHQIRKGNIRARLRMITLYNLASKHKGFVASTDNFSELAAGFWTLHGDVGDVAPIQSLTKSWEVPRLAEALDVPESILRATPTDGLGIANGDEAQFGFSYMEFDAVLVALIKGVEFSQHSDDTKKLVAEVKKRIGSTSFKRANPYNLDHPIERAARFNELARYDSIS